MKLSAIHDSPPPCSEATLQEFEAKIGATLPSDYRRFLALKNGGFIHHNYSHVHASIKTLYGLNAPFDFYDLGWSYQTLTGVIPATYLSIGADGCGNELCISLSGKLPGSVFFWDHESFDFKAAFSDPLADSFDTFINQLSINTDESYIDIEGVDAQVTEGFRAIAEDDVSSLVKCIAAGLDANSTDGDSKSLLHYAAGECHLECVEALIKYGADVDAACDGGTTPLFMAIQQHCCDCVTLLLDLGASIEKPLEDGTRPLQEAIESRSVLEAGTLIMRGADASLPFSDGRSASEWVRELYDSEIDGKERDWLLALL